MTDHTSNLWTLGITTAELTISQCPVPEPPERGPSILHAALGEWLRVRRMLLHCCATCDSGRVSIAGHSCLTCIIAAKSSDDIRRRRSQQLLDEDAWVAAEAEAAARANIKCPTCGLGRVAVKGDQCCGCVMARRRHMYYGHMERALKQNEQ